MEINPKQKMIESIINDFRHYEAGYFLTINALTSKKELFESQIVTITHWLNKYCYGRSYQRKLKLLRVVGVFEIGTVNEGLHIHLIIMHEFTKRTFEEINAFLRKKCYRLMNARGSIFGSLIDLQLVGDLDSRVEYISKTFYQENKDFSFVYF